MKGKKRIRFSPISLLLFFPAEASEGRRAVEEKGEKAKLFGTSTKAEWKKEKHAFKRPTLRGIQRGPLLDAVSLFSMQPDSSTPKLKAQEAAAFSPFSSPPLTPERRTIDFLIVTIKQTHFS